MKAEETERIGNEHLYEILTNKEVSWQSVIYDLINTGQLNPWDIDLSLLVNRYLARVRELEEANFFVSSKVLFAASLILRIKSEILLNEYIRSIDEILFGKKEEPEKVYERIEIDESELPFLYPKTPLPRMRKISLQELVLALSKAINTENRRIRKEINSRQIEKYAEIALPKARRVNIKERIRKIYSRVLTLFKTKKSKISYTELVGHERDERISAFLPVLHLEHQQKVWLEQEKHLGEIWVWLYSHYKSQGVIRAQELAEEKNNAKQAGFENPLAGFFDLVTK